MMTIMSVLTTIMSVLMTIITAETTAEGVEEINKSCPSSKVKFYLRKNSRSRTGLGITDCPADSNLSGGVKPILSIAATHLAPRPLAIHSNG